MLHADALVHTARGLIAASDVRLGDTAFVLEEADRGIVPCVVTGVHTTAPAPFIEIAAGGRVARLERSALCLALVDRRRPGRQRRRFKTEWVPASDVRAGDIVAVARKTPDLGAIPELTLPSPRAGRRTVSARLPPRPDADLMWWSGAYIGDGYVHHRGRNNSVEFAIPASQSDLRSELVSVTRRLFGVVAYAPDEWRVAVPGGEIAAYIEAIGLGGVSLTKRVPAWVFATPEPFRLAFLGGYVDTDGMVRAGASKDMGATSADRALLEDVRRLAVTCGVRSSRVWTFTSRHPVDRARVMTGYRMQFSGDFDRIACRALQRRERMHKRKFFHNDTSVGGAKLYAHVSEWIGFARVDRISVPIDGAASQVQMVRQGALVVDGIVVARGDKRAETPPV